MTALTELFFDAVYFPRSVWSVVGWWERRRLTYNVAVGTAGLLTLAVLGLLGALPPAPFVLAAVAVYGLAANVCYSAGVVADLVARRIGGPPWAPVGPTLFRYGFVFSIGLTLLPVPIAILGWVVGLIVRMVGG